MDTANDQFKEYDTDQVATASEPLFLLKGEYLNKAEAAAGLGVSPATLDRWNRIRIGPVRTKIGNQVYYRVAELKAWMRAQQEAVAQRRA
jgi:phage terminase Nu1 subunit (DNA packaging protein)